MGYDNWLEQPGVGATDDAFRAGMAYADMIHELRFQHRAVELLNDAEIANLNRVTMKCECAGMAKRVKHAGVHGH